MSADAGLRHTGATAKLVHNLKYRRSLPAGRLLAAAMVRALPVDASALIPLPRSLGRKIIYGIDQAEYLSAVLGRLTGLPVVHALRAPLWWKRQAGAAHEDRHRVAFTVRASPPAGAVLIDDVLTTGLTAHSAALALGLERFSLVVASSAGTMGSGTEPFPSKGGGVTRMREGTDDQPRAAQPLPRARMSESGSVVSARPDAVIDREETE